MTVTRAQVIEAVAEVHADAHLSLFDGTARDAAERAYTPGGPSLDELEQRIRAYRNTTQAPASSTPDASQDAAYRRHASVPSPPNPSLVSAGRAHKSA